MRDAQFIPADPIDGVRVARVELRRAGVALADLFAVDQILIRVIDANQHAGKSVSHIVGAPCRLIVRRHRQAVHEQIKRPPRRVHDIEMAGAGKE